MTITSTVANAFLNKMHLPMRGDSNKGGGCERGGDAERTNKKRKKKKKALAARCVHIGVV